MRIYCSGDLGVWKCKDATEDHMVDVSRFTKETNTVRGLQARCVDCVKSYNDRNNSNREAYYIEGAKLLGIPKINEELFYSLLSKAQRAICRDLVRRNDLPNTAPMVFPKLRDKKPKFNQGKYKSPLARAVAKSKVKQNPGFAREGPGFVYVYEDEMKMPGVLKIGSTQYSNGRLASANTWGAFTCLYEKEFERRYEAEDMVHDILDYCRIYSDKEWFRVTLTVAIKAIGEVRIDIRKKQKVG